MKSSRKSVIHAVVLASILAGCGGAPDDDTVLATVGEQEITVGQFERAYTNMPAAERPDLGTLEAKRTFLDDLVNKRILELSAAEKYPELTQQQEWRLTRFRGTEVTKRIRKKLMADQVHVSEAMKDRTYENMKRELDLMAIQVNDPDEAEYIREELDAGADFGQLARDHSVKWVNDEIAGNLGWVSPGLFPYEFEQQIWAADEGDVVGPYHEALGSYVVKVVGERPYALASSREELDGSLHEIIFAPAYMNRQKAVLDSLHQAQAPFYTSEGKALVMRKYYWEPPADQADNPYAFLDASRATPNYTPEEGETVVIEFQNAPDWTFAEFSERLSWLPSGMWPRGHSEAQMIEAFDIMVRDFLLERAAQDEGILENPEFLATMENRRQEMRVTYFYYNNILKGFEPTQEQIEEYYEEYRDHYRAPRSYKVAFFASADKGLMENLVSDWKEGASYGELRERYEARDPGLITVGESPWIYEGSDALRDGILKDLEEGAVSNTVTTRDTTMAFRLLRRRPARQLPYAEIKADVDAHAKEVLVDRRLKQFLAVQADRFGVTVNENALRELELEVPADEPAPGGGV